MFEAKKLHPIAAILNTIKNIRELIFPFIAFVFIGGKNSEWELFYFVASIAVLVFILVSGILSWLRFSYRIEEGELRIESGIFVRKKRYIPFERIQSLDVSEGLLHRPLGLVKMKVETAGASGPQEAEAMLSAISKSDAAIIQNHLAAAKNGTKNAQEIEVAGPQLMQIYSISNAELLLLSSTSGGVGVVLSAVLAFMSQFEQFFPYDRVFKGFEKVITNGIFLISLLALLGFFIAWAVALLGTMLKYADFTVVRSGDDLIISRGLLEKRQLTIPLQRIQAVWISENFIRQLFGFATVYVDSAGGSVLDAESSRVMVLPFIKKKHISRIIGPHLSGYELDVDFKGAPKRSLKRYLFRTWCFVVPPVAALIIFLRPWGYLSLCLLAIASYWAYLKYRDAGWNVSSDQLSLRFRNIIRQSVFLKKNKIQSLNAKESYFQQSKELATVHAVVKSGDSASGGHVVDLEKDDVNRIYKWYSYER